MCQNERMDTCGFFESNVVFGFGVRFSFICICGLRTRDYDGLEGGSLKNVPEIEK